MRRIFFALIGSLISCAAVFAVSFPTTTGFITDTTHTLSSATITALTTELQSYEQQTGTELAVAMISTTGGEPIAQYATELGNAWGIGKKGADNGVLLVIAKDDRELFIATGSQTEGALTDIIAKDIIDQVITPRFRMGDYDGGVQAGVDAEIAALKGASFTSLRMGHGTHHTSGDAWLFFLVLPFWILSWLASILGRSKAIWPGAVIGGVAGLMGSLFFMSILWEIALFTALCALFGLGFDYVVSRNYEHYQKSGGTPPWWIGGGWGGGTSGGGFGGFGGGGFSGGGAGGSW